MVVAGVRVVSWRRRAVITPVLEGRSLVTKGVPSEQGMLTLKRELVDDDTLLFVTVSPRGTEWKRWFIKEEK